MRGKIDKKFGCDYDRRGLLGGPKIGTGRVVVFVVVAIAAGFIGAALVVVVVACRLVIPADD